MYSVFQDTPEWDKEKKYTPENLNVYFKDFNETVCSVNLQETLREVLQKKE